MLSLTVDFYVRLFIRVHEGAKPCHESIGRYSQVFQCLECEAHYLHPYGIHTFEETTFDKDGKKTKRHVVTKKAEAAKEEEGDEEEKTSTRERYHLPKFRIPHQCSVCDGPLIMGGPIWNEPIYNIDFVKRLLASTRLNAEGQNGHKVKTTDRIQAILSAVIDESVLSGTPLSYEFSHIVSTLKAVNPRKGQILAAFNSLGYMVAQTYYDPKLFKTNAPPEVVYDIFKAWKHHVSGGDPKKVLLNITEGSLAHRII